MQVIEVIFTNLAEYDTTLYGFCRQGWTLTVENRKFPEFNGGFVREKKLFFGFFWGGSLSTSKYILW